jgi:hypothetical protein
MAYVVMADDQSQTHEEYGESRLEISAFFPRFDTELFGFLVHAVTLRR